MRLYSAENTVSVTVKGNSTDAISTDEHSVMSMVSAESSCLRVLPTMPSGTTLSGRVYYEMCANGAVWLLC